MAGALRNQTPPAQLDKKINAKNPTSSSHQRKDRGGVERANATAKMIERNSAVAREKRMSATSTRHQYGRLGPKPVHRRAAFSRTGTRLLLQRGATWTRIDTPGRRPAGDAPCVERRGGWRSNASE